MGKGSNTTTTQSTSSADPQAAALYRDILSRAQGVASTPYQAYTGDLSAPTNSQQQLGVAGINANANYASPFIQQATGLASSSTAPLSAAAIQQYLNPYTQSVVDATTQQLQHDNAQAMAQLQGNQIAQGALGGNATGVARGILAGQQGRTNASTIAGLYSQGYSQALQAAQQQQQMGLAGANAIANYGISGQNAALTGANAQFGVGTQQQATDQAALDRLYQQYLQAQAYPYQQSQWLAGMATGVGSNLGGYSSGTSTGPAPNQTAQYLGLGLSAAGMFLSDRDAKEDIEHIGQTNDGQNIYRYRYKGRPEYHIGLIAQEVKQEHPEAVEKGVGGLHYVDLKGATDDAVSRASGGGVGGTPFANAPGWIPTMNIHGGSGAPHASAPGLGNSGQPTAQDFSKVASGLTGVGSKLQGLDWGGGYDAGLGNLSGDSWGGGSFWKGDQYGGSSAAPLPGLSAADYGFARGGGVMGYADGGSPDLPEWLAGDYNPLDAQADAEAGRKARGVEPASWMNFEDRAAPVKQAIVSGDFDPQFQNYTPFEGSPGMVASNTGTVPLPAPRPAAAGPVVAADDDEEAGAPTGVAGAGRAAQAPVMAFQPEGSQSYRGLPDAITRPRSGDEPGFGLGLLSRNQQTGLLTAGLSMLANRSPFLGVAVGEGGLAGLGAYGAANEADRKAALEAEKLSREAQNTFFNQNLSTRKQNETERHNRATEEDSARGAKLPALYSRDKDGNITLAPGAYEATEQLAKARKGPAVGPSMSPDTIEFMADRIIAGDTKVLTGLGRGAQGAENIAAVQEAVARKAAAGAPISAAAREILSNAAQFEGLKTAERTQAGIMAKLSVYGRTAYNATSIAERLSDEVPRTNFIPVNRIFNAARTNTGDPKIVALGQALMTLTNEYARAIGGGHGTVHDKEAAEKRLSMAQSQEQLRAVINVMRQEILAEERAMPAARQHVRDIYNPPAGGVVHSIGGEHGAPDAGTSVPPVAQREVNKVYKTPKGDLRWTGSGWVQP